jgi:predicted phosphodiesterase
MKAHLLTDVHNEHRSAPYRVEDLDFDILILAGDIDSGLGGITWAAEESQRLGVPAIYVAGNHEFYGTELLSHDIAMRIHSTKLGVHYLNNEALVIDGVRFLGTTLWTDYQLTGEHSYFVEYQIRRAMSDHRLIRYGESLFSPGHAQMLHSNAIEWLEEHLQKQGDYETTVAVSHHGPSQRCVHPKWTGSIVSNAYCSHLDHLVAQADFWFYGHTHAALDTLVEQTRLVTNPAGYPGQETGFKSDLVIDLKEGKAK